MRYIWQHIQSIIESYKGEVPLTHFLKGYFKQYPILGSRDRRILSEMAYAWYRCKKGISNSDLSIEEKVKICLFLTGSNSKHIIPFIPEDWQKESGSTILEKTTVLQHQNIFFNLNDIFPHLVELSDDIANEAWLSSMLSQPRLFIRIRKEKEKAVRLLTENTIDFQFVTNTCLALANGTSIDKILPAEWYVVQDASSQKTGSYFHPHKNEQWYDCCSGAGGKSLLLKDLEPGVQLTVSDKRESILHNLKQRFKLYHHKAPVAHVADVADRKQLQKALGKQQFDNIICDAPCSGSGTWARTPEQIFFFDTDAVQKFPLLQQSIAIDTISYLKKGGRLIYITCSVFKKENESVVNHIITHTGMELEKMELINGIDIGADSMFIAVLRKHN